jgi:hypothetical protein
VYRPEPESYNPLLEIHTVDADKSNAFPGFAPVDDVAVKVGDESKTLLKSPTTVGAKVHVFPLVDVATAVGEP